MNFLAKSYAALSAQQATVHFLGNLLTFRGDAKETEGELSVIQCLTAPGAGAPPHRQQDHEAFLVLEGAFEFLIDGAWSPRGPGDFVYIKPGTPHAFRNPEATPSKMLIFNMPGGPHQDFFFAVGEPVEPGQTSFPPMGEPDIAFIMQQAPKFGIELLPPQAG